MEPIDLKKEAKRILDNLRTAVDHADCELEVELTGILARHTRWLADEVEEGGIVDEDASLFKVANWLRQQADKLERGKGV